MTVSFVNTDNPLRSHGFPLRLREGFLNPEEYKQVCDLWFSWTPFPYQKGDLSLEGLDYEANNTRRREEFLKRLTSEEFKTQHEDLLKLAIRGLPELMGDDILIRFNEADRDPLMFLNSIGVSPFELLNILMDAFDGQVCKRVKKTIFNWSKTDANNAAKAAKDLAIALRICMPELILRKEFPPHLSNPEDFKFIGKIFSAMAVSRRPKEPGKKRRLPKVDLRRETVAELFHECMPDLSFSWNDFPSVAMHKCYVVAHEKTVLACIACLMKAAYPEWYRPDVKNLLRQVKEDSSVKVVYD